MPTHARERHRNRTSELPILIDLRYEEKVKNSRLSEPRYPPCVEVARLRELGWTVLAIAMATGVTRREAYRWAAGDARPRSSHLELLKMLGPPPRARRKRDV